MHFWWKKRPPPAPPAPEPPAPPLVPVASPQVAHPVTLIDQSRWWVQGSDETVQKFSKDRRDEEVARQLAKAMLALERQSREGQQSHERQLQHHIQKLRRALNRRRNRKRNRGHRHGHNHRQHRTIDVEFRRTR
jgi:hypothetical protein